MSDFHDIEQCLGDEFRRALTTEYHVVKREKLLTLGRPEHLYVRFHVSTGDAERIDQDSFLVMHAKPCLLAMAREFEELGEIYVAPIPLVPQGLGVMMSHLEPVPLRYAKEYTLCDTRTGESGYFFTFDILAVPHA